VIIAILGDLVEYIMHANVGNLCPFRPLLGKEWLFSRWPNVAVKKSPKRREYFKNHNIGP
jgi:hypothetical protein